MLDFGTPDAALERQARALNRIKIDLDRTAGSIDRNVFGGFVEHLGRCVYGGIFDPASPLADENGLRSDVRAALERLRLSVVRYPGGNFASGYRWRDGVGPAAERPRRADVAWGAVDPNTFGTNEFIRFCRTLDLDPYLVVNAGDGDMREARDWVEYCNGTADTALTRLRAAHGYPEPHRVRYWSVGNEVDGSWQIGAKTAAEYARTYQEFAKVMRLADPDIKLIASATSDWDSDIVERVQLLVEAAGDLIDYISIHWYAGDLTGDSAAYLATSEVIERRLSGYEGLMRGMSLGRTSLAPIPLAVDEWNVWYRTTQVPRDGAPNLAEEHYDLQDALVVAMHLNAFVRHAATVRMANLAQLVNAIAPITTADDGILLHTTFYPFELYTRTCGTLALDAWWEGDTFTGGTHTGVRTLDVAASLDPDAQRLSVYIVNRHLTDGLDTTIELESGRFSGIAEIATITGADLKDRNTFDRPDAVTTIEDTREVAPSETFAYTAPPRSVTGLVIPLSRR
jgi:alpha-N-arabinofuranosidase